MKQLYDENGNPISSYEAVSFAADLMSGAKKNERERLKQKVVGYINGKFIKRDGSTKFQEHDAEMLIKFIEDSQKNTIPFFTPGGVSRCSEHGGYGFMSDCIECNKPQIGSE